MEMDETLAIKMGLEHRLDLRVTEEKVYDAQRTVVVQADKLGAELTLFGEAELGQSRSISTAGLDNARLDTGKGIYTGLFKLDLPLDRTSERNAYRNSFIALERAVRNVQDLEDDIKLTIRERLRNMYATRQGISTEARAVSLAEKRVKSTSMFLDAGRAELSDLLDAQESLLTTRNALTAAIIDYRVAELQFQSVTGLLSIANDGLFIEYKPGGNKNDKE